MRNGGMAAATHGRATRPSRRGGGSKRKAPAGGTAVACKSTPAGRHSGKLTPGEGLRAAARPQPHEVEGRQALHEAAASRRGGR